MWQKCTPKKKVCIVCGLLVAIIILSGCLYIGIQGKNIENRIWDYLKENGYEEAEIKSVDVKHSFMNVLLSYNEWTVDVVFEDEQTSIYIYTIKDGAIIQSGVSGTTNKEDLKHTNNDYKDTTTETLNVTGAMKFVAGQSLLDEISYSSKAYPVAINEPPEMVVVCGEEQITALKGTYSWEYSNEDGTCTGVEADSAHPLECKEIMPDVGIIYATTSALHPRRAYLEFDIVPTEVEVRYWNEEDWNNTTAESKSLDVQALEIDAADSSYSTDYIVELLEGNYIYEVTAKWSGSEKYNGTAYYSFYTVLGDYELVTEQK